MEKSMRVYNRVRTSITTSKMDQYYDFDNIARLSVNEETMSKQFKS
jgi:hypothetical protein